MKDDFYLTWIGLMKNINIDILIKLISNLSYDLKVLYEISKEEEKFRKYVIKNKISIFKQTYDEIIDDNLKEKSKKFYFFIKKQNIEVISTFSSQSYFDYSSHKNFIPVLFIFGNKKIFNLKKYFVYSEKNSSEILEIEEKLKAQANRKGYALVETKDGKNVDIVVTTLDQTFNITNANNKKKLYIFSNIEAWQIISYVFDTLVIINSKYKLRIVNVVENSLNLNKEIKVIPNSILDKNSYFSNYLIYQGADIIYRIDEMWKKLLNTAVFLALYLNSLYNTSANFCKGMILCIKIVQLKCF